MKRLGGSAKQQQSTELTAFRKAEAGNSECAVLLLSSIVGSKESKYLEHGRFSKQEKQQEPLGVDALLARDSDSV